MSANLIDLIVEALVFSVIGIIIFFIAFFVMERITHFSVQKEIVEKQNLALAIVIGAIVLGISMIIAFAHG